MAVYTEVSDDELRAFLATYDVGELMSYKGIAEGVENTNYLVSTNQASYILTLYEKRVKQDDLPFFIDLMDHLAVSGFSCPSPVKDREGQTLKILAGRPAAMVTFLDGICVTRPKRDHCRELGTAVAQFHLAGQNFSQTRRNALSQSDWQNVFEPVSDQADAIVPGLRNCLEDELEYLNTAWPKSLPTGIIHADLFPDNVFFLKDKVSGFIDFYFACTDSLAYELAICLNAWCFERENEFNITNARSLLNAYNALRPLTDEEMHVLPILARGAAVRFLVTRLYDWIHTNPAALVKPKDPREYLRKLRFHQSIKTAGEYGLAQLASGVSS